MFLIKDLSAQVTPGRERWSYRLELTAIHFRKGFSLPESQRLQGTEEQCEAALQKARWPEGSAVRASQVMRSGCPLLDRSGPDIVNSGQEKHG